VGRAILRAGALFSAPKLALQKPIRNPLVPKGRKKWVSDLGDGPPRPVHAESRLAANIGANIGCPTKMEQLFLDRP